MKVFLNYTNAIESNKDKKKYFLNSTCPYNPDTKVCGNWCALFYLDEGGESTTPYVILGCKAGEKKLYVEEIIGE